jgi:hypothetical protein
MASRLILVCLVAALLSGCASWPRRWGAAPCRIETKPVVRRQPVWWHLFDVTVLEPLEQPFHLVRPARKLAGVPTRALNLREGRVADSAFFTDRDPAQLTPEQVRWGPTRPDDVAVAPLVVTKSKMEGKTAGFFATDARGRRYLLKLDPVEAPELLSGAEVVASKLLHALGYRVPSYEVLMVRAEQLQVASDAVGKAPDGGLRPFTQADFDGLLAGRLRDGAVRVAASEIIAGEILGPARFKRFRDCAEIRALRVAYAWLNNIDTKDHNSLLVWDGTRTLGYLIDFGTSLGADAGAGGPKPPCAGWKHVVDLREASLELLTLGLHRSRCPLDAQSVSPSVGLFPAHLDPERWKPYAPNVAFQEMNDEDARWLARRLARLSRAQIEAAVSAGRYSNPADAAYLAEALIGRRDDIISYYLGEG